MSSRLIPKEQLTGFRRWDIGSFDGQRDATPPIAPVKLPTAAELEALQQHAHDEGYRAGFEQARLEGERLRRLTQSFSQAMCGIEETVAEELLTLALDIARQVLREALSVKPELILPVVREAVGALAEPLQSPVLMLHPADVELVRQRLGDELALGGWKVLADERIEPGGCRVESVNGEANATLAIRWQRVIATLNCNHSWLG